MSKSDFEMLLLKEGIKRGTGNFLDYEESKKIIETCCTDSSDYERRIKAAADFIGV